MICQLCGRKHHTYKRDLDENICKKDKELEHWDLKQESEFNKQTDYMNKMMHDIIRENPKDDELKRKSKTAILKR